MVCKRILERILEVGEEKVKFAVDLDGVIANTSILMKQVALERGVSIVFNAYKPEDPFGNLLEKLTSEIVHEIFTNRMGSVQPYKDALAHIPLIASLGSITFLTARNGEYNEATRDWINTHFKVSYEFANRPSSEKTSFVLKNGFDCLIEDRLKTANFAAENGVKVYLINRHWNMRRKTHSNVIRIHSLGQFYSDNYLAVAHYFST